MLFADGREQEAGQRLGHADQHAAEQRARHRAEPADDDDDEGEQRVGRSERRRHVDDQHQHRAGRADAGRAEPEGQRVEPLHVEPDHQRAGVVVGAGADRLADIGEAEEREQRGRDHDRGAGRIDLGGVDDDAAEREAVERVGRLHAARIRPEDAAAAR